LEGAYEQEPGHAHPIPKAGLPGHKNLNQIILKLQESYHIIRADKPKAGAPVSTGERQREEEACEAKLESTFLGADGKEVIGLRSINRKA